MDTDHGKTFRRSKATWVFFVCMTVFFVQFLGRIMHAKSSLWH